MVFSSYLKGASKYFIEALIFSSENVLALASRPCDRSPSVWDTQHSELCRHALIN